MGFKKPEMAVHSAHRKKDDQKQSFLDILLSSGERQPRKERDGGKKSASLPHRLPQIPTKGKRKKGSLLFSQFHHFFAANQVKEKGRGIAETF